MKRITYGTISAGLAVLAVGVGLSACALLQPLTQPILGETASEQTRVWAERVFLGFNKGWIPALDLYRGQKQCGPGIKPPCWEPDVYLKLHAVTDAVTACQVAATAPGVPLVELEACVSRVSAAKVTFTQSGVAPIGDVQ